MNIPPWIENLHDITTTRKTLRNQKKSINQQYCHQHRRIYSKLLEEEGFRKIISFESTRIISNVFYFLSKWKYFFRTLLEFQILTLASERNQIEMGKKMSFSWLFCEIRFSVLRRLDFRMKVLDDTVSLNFLEWLNVSIYNLIWFKIGVVGVRDFLLSYFHN